MSDQPTPPATPASDTIAFEDFAKVKLRTGKVIEAGIHPNADKLLVLKVDLGNETRQIVAGIRAFYTPEQLHGKNVIIVSNLAPRTMRGVESQGMLLAATTADRSCVVVLTTESEVPPGSTVS